MQSRDDESRGQQIMLAYLRKPVFNFVDRGINGLTGEDRVHKRINRITERSD